MCRFQCAPISGVADVESSAVAQVWTYKHRVAFVLSVTENGMPVQDGIKLQRLQQLLFGMMDGNGDGIVDIKRVRGCPCSVDDSLCCGDNEVS